MITQVSLFFAATALIAVATAAPEANTSKRAPGVKAAQATTSGNSVANPLRQTKRGSRTPTSSAAAMTAPSVSASVIGAVEPKLTNRSFSEYSYQVGEGQKSITVTPEYAKSDRSYDIKGAKVSESYLYNTVKLNYSRAFGPEWVGSVAGSIGTAEVSSTGQSYRSTGFGDFTFSGQKLETTDDGQMFRGFFVNLTPGDRRFGYEATAGAVKKSGDGNLYSGGHSFGGFVGKQYITADKIYGVRGSGQYFLPRNATQGTAGRDLEYEQTGGHTFSGETFAEYPHKKPIYLGAKAGLSYIMTSDIGIKGATTANYSSDPRQLLHLGAYGRINYTDSVTVLPAVQINKQLNSASGSWSYEGQDDFVLNVGARIAL